MLRSTFDAFNVAHPDRPLINPRGCRRGHPAGQGPATVAELGRFAVFAFDLDAPAQPRPTSR